MALIHQNSHGQRQLDGEAMLREVSVEQVTGPSILESNSFFRLNQSVYLYEPFDSLWEDADSAERDLAEGAPDTVILLSWMNARLRHFLKYANGYRQLFPRAQILLIMASQNDVSLRTDSGIKRELRPALEQLMKQKEENYIVHTFSIAGAKKLHLLAESFLEKMGRYPCFDRIILDSTPTIMHARRSIATFRAGHKTTGILKHLVDTACVLDVGLLWVLRETGIKDDVRKLWDGLNDIEIEGREKRRCYIYSHEDISIRWKDVERHAAEAQSKGWSTRLELFKGSKHVQHMRLDPARYWSIVQSIARR